MTSYRATLKEEFSKMIDALSLNELQKSYLRLRWLDQVLWMEGKAASARGRYYAARVIAIVGGLIVPALVGINFEGRNSDAVRIATVILSLVAAISTAVESLFHFGDRWRHYRATAEQLKMEGWQFIELGGRYQKLKNHGRAFDAFSDQVESVILADIRTFKELIKEKGSSDQNT